MLKYRTVAISELTPGSILATPLFDERYVKLLDTGMVVDQHFLDRLKERGVTEVRVKSAAIHVVTPDSPVPTGIKVLPKGDTLRVDRCSNCGAQIALKPPKPDSQASAWLCKKCGAVYFCADDGNDDERLGVSRAEPKTENPFAARVEVKLDAKTPSIPPENVQRLVKSLVTPQYTGDDRRRHKRYPVAVPVVAVALAADFRIVGEPVKMTTADVSLGGAALIHTRFVDAPYLALDFSSAGIELMQVILKVLRVRNIGPVYQVAGEFISQLSQRPYSSAEGVMSGQGQPSGNVAIVIRFQGGVKDRTELRSDEPEKRVNDANMIWSLTRKGSVGRRFDWYEPDGSRHRYAVIDKLCTPDAIIVTCAYVGAG